METVVDQTLGNVFHADTSLVLDRTQIDDAFVCHQTMGAAIQDREMRCQAMRNVVRRQDGAFRSFLQTFAPHQRNVSP